MNDDMKNKAEAAWRKIKISLSTLKSVFFKLWNFILRVLIFAVSLALAFFIYCFATNQNFEKLLFSAIDNQNLQMIAVLSIALAILLFLVFVTRKRAPQTTKNSIRFAEKFFSICLGISTVVFSVATFKFVSNVDAAQILPAETGSVSVVLNFSGFVSVTIAFIALLLMTAFGFAAFEIKKMKNER